MSLRTKPDTELQLRSATSRRPQALNISDHRLYRHCDPCGDEDGGLWVFRNLLFKDLEECWVRCALPILSNKARTKRPGEKRINDPRDSARDHQREEGSACVTQDRGGTAEALHPNHVARGLIPNEERVTRPVMGESLDRLRPVPHPVLQRGPSGTPMQDVRRSRLDGDQQWRHAA
jgi:hypothetical protein